MMKRFLSSETPNTSLVRSPSSPSNPPETAKKSHKKQPDDVQVSLPKKVSDSDQNSSPTLIQTTKNKDYANVDIPQLVLPTCPFSNNEMKNERIVTDKSDHGHTRNDSFETTISQSMDLTTFIKSLELQQENKNEEHPPHNSDKRAPERSSNTGDGSNGDSLSLAASQVDISVANDAEDIHIDSSSDRSDYKALGNNNDDSKEITTIHPKRNNDIKRVVSEDSIKLTLDPSSSPSVFCPEAKVKDSFDPDAMACVGEQLYRESLAIGKISTSPSSKKFRIAKTTLVMSLIVIVTFIYFGGSNDSTGLNETVKLVATPTYDVMEKEVQGFLPSNFIQDTTVSQNTDLEQNYIEENIDSDKNNSQNRTIEDRSCDEKKSIRSNLSDEPGSNQVQHDYVDHLEEGFTSYDNDGPNSSDPNRHGSYGLKLILEFCLWSIALLTVISRLLLGVRSVFTSSSSKNRLKIESKVGAIAPATPTNASLHRKQDSFLTPPSHCKNNIKEPKEWMSPCYGDDGIDVSTYRAFSANELRLLLRERQCDSRGTKEQMIKMLIMSYQNELACLTVHQLRPKLRRLKLSQKGTKKEIVRRLVEAGPMKNK